MFDSYSWKSGKFIGIFFENAPNTFGNIFSRLAIPYDFILGLFSVVDPNTLNLDPNPDPGFWLNLYPDPGLPVCYPFWKKEIEIILEEKVFKTKCKKRNTISKEICNQFSHWIGN